jgi:hypothetical protein
MNADKHEAQRSALNASIAKSREEMATLASRLNSLAIGLCDVEGDESKGPSLQHRIGEAGSRAKWAVKGLKVEIERHPLIGGMAAFGLGFGLAAVLFKRAKSDAEE